MIRRSDLESNRAKRDSTLIRRRTDSPWRTAELRAEAFEEAQAADWAWRRPASGG
jgi:hypothetical protein